MEFLEAGQASPAQKTISEVLENFDSESIKYAWEKALERKVSDPEGQSLYREPSLKVYANIFLIIVPSATPLAALSCLNYISLRPRN